MRNADGVKNLRHIVDGENDLFIIVSAMGKTTNALERVFTHMQKAEKEAAARRMKSVENTIDFVKAKITEVLKATDQQKVKGVFYSFAQAVSNTTKVDTDILNQRYLAVAEDAIRAATYNPACALGQQDQIGSIETGKLADFIVCSADYKHKQVYLGGKAL